MSAKIIPFPRKKPKIVLRPEILGKIIKRSENLGFYHFEKIIDEELQVRVESIQEMELDLELYLEYVLQEFQTMYTVRMFFDTLIVWGSPEMASEVFSSASEEAREIILHYAFNT